MPRHVLVIDDSASIRTLSTMALERGGFAVQQAEDGEAAIELLDGRPFDAIVCDLSMPRMDGLSFLRWLRVHPRYRGVPLLVLSTETRAEVRTATRIEGPVMGCAMVQAPKAVQAIQKAAGTCSGWRSAHSMM